MDNDKAFAIYALTVLAGLASVITASMLAGSASLPSALSFAEHLALSLSFRAAYKGLGGFSWEDWSLLSGPSAREKPPTQPVSRPRMAATS